MTDSTRPLEKKLLTLPVPQDDDVETQLLIWIRGVVQSNHELVGAMKRLRHSYKALLAGKSVAIANAKVYCKQNPESFVSLRDYIGGIYNETCAAFAAEQHIADPTYKIGSD
jgi:hypothetical protein